VFQWHSSLLTRELMITQLPVALIFLASKTSPHSGFLYR
jgi:hypothetical protein